MRARLQDQRGISSVELALTLPILLLVLVAGVTLVRAGWEYMVVSRAAAAGVRYATRVDVNARHSPSGTLTRRPSATEVEAFVRDAAAPLAVASVSVDPEPVGTLPGEVVTVTVSHVLALGPLPGVANGLTSAFFGGDLLPESATVTVSARGREE